jgi:hypothetical protein
LNLQLCRKSSPEFSCHGLFCIQFGSHFILRFCEHWKREQLAPLFKNPCQRCEISPRPMQAVSHHMILSMFSLVGIPRLPLFLHELSPRSKCEPLLDESVILLCGPGSVNTDALEK